MRSLPAMGSSPVGAMPFDRDARRRGLELRVGVALPSPRDDRAMMELLDTVRHLEAHGASSIWLDVAVARSGGPALAAAVGVVRATRRLAVHVGTAAAGTPGDGRRLDEAMELADGRLGVVVMPGGGGDEPDPAATKRAPAWIAGGPEAASLAVGSGAGWLATDADPQTVLRAAVAAAEGRDGRGGEPEPPVGVVLHSALVRGELAATQHGATGPVSLRTLIERHIAVGASHFVLVPLAQDLRRWTHEVCLPVSSLASVQPAPCGC